MRTREWRKLKVGDRVSVTGTMSNAVFAGEKGVVIDYYSDASDNIHRTIKFDTWRGGWESSHDHWTFNVKECRHYNITVLPEVKPEPIKAAKKRPHGKQEYKGNGKHEWENVTFCTERLRVPSGWLYSTRAGFNCDPAVTFVPMPEAVGYEV